MRRCARPHHLAGDLVGIDHGDAPRRQQPRHRALAGTDVPGESPNPHAGSLLFRAVPALPEAGAAATFRPFMRASLAILMAASGALASDLVGPIACRTCHAEAYRIWAEGP